MDKNKLSDELTEAFIEYQWRLDNPFPRPDITKKDKIEMYLVNSVFNAKVRNLTGGVMRIIESHI